MNINTIVQNVTTFIQNKLSIPLIPIPAVMLICSTLKRPGLSSMLITSRVISRLPSLGINTGVNIDGSENLLNQVLYVTIDEIVNAIKNDSKTEIAIAPGSITTVGKGANSGGPVVITSTNVQAISGSGITR